MEQPPHEDFIDDETISSNYKITDEDYVRVRPDAVAQTQSEDENSQPEVQPSISRDQQRFNRKFGSRILRLNHPGRNK